MTKEKKNHVIQISNIIKNSKLDAAQFANKGLVPVEYDVEVVKVAEKITRYFTSKKKKKK